MKVTRCRGAEDREGAGINSGKSGARLRVLEAEPRVLSRTTPLQVIQSSAFLVRNRELCEGRGGRPGLSVTNSPSGLCGRKATLKANVP